MTERTDYAPAVAPLLLSTRAAAATLSIGTRKLWELTNRRQIPHLRIGRRVLYDIEDLRAWIGRQKERPR